MMINGRAVNGKQLRDVMMSEKGWIVTRCRSYRSRSETKWFVGDINLKPSEELSQCWGEMSAGSPPPASSSTVNSVFLANISLAGLAPEVKELVLLRVGTDVVWV